MWRTLGLRIYSLSFVMTSPKGEYLNRKQEEKLGWTVLHGLYNSEVPTSHSRNS